LESFDATVYCTSANKRLKPPASLIQQRRIPVCAGIFLNYQNQDRFTKPQSGEPLASGSYMPLPGLASTHLKILGKQ
jgi:hypothetical protein